eukprot:TRINITY_DN3651_c0_g3_i2.p1 TRINITY_DN3651_c0_g3~~TRINITY_DN3651_c0_g3_i2.p1  ORF type:complete len:116 (+),score=13.99 TRINITY_DN3651_c0_g3_i2:157-504(+)
MSFYARTSNAMFKQCSDITYFASGCVCAWQAKANKAESLACVAVSLRLPTIQQLPACQISICARVNVHSIQQPVTAASSNWKRAATLISACLLQVVTEENPILSFSHSSCKTNSE